MVRTSSEEASMKPRNWRDLRRAWFDFDAHAASELRTRLDREVDRLAEARGEALEPGQALPGTATRQWEYARAAIHAELDALDVPLDLLTGRAQRPLLDWEVIGGLDGPDRSRDAMRWLYRVRSAIRERMSLADPEDAIAMPRGRRRNRWDDRTPLDPSGADPDGVDPPDPGIVPPVDARRVMRITATALVPFNAPARRALLELAERFTTDTVGRSSRAWLDLEDAIEGDASLAMERDRLSVAQEALALLAHGRLVAAPAPPHPEHASEGNLGVWNQVLSPADGGLATAHPLVAWWLLKVTLLAWRPDLYPPSAAGLYAPRGLGADVVATLRSWGYARRLKQTVSEGAETLRAIETTVRAALVPAEKS